MVSFKKLTTIETFPTKGTLKGFLDAVSIWINKPHVVNKRLCGTKITYITTSASTGNVEGIIASALAERNVAVSSEPHVNADILQVDLKENDDKFVVVIRELLPKKIKSSPGLLEAVIYDSDNYSVTFHPLLYTSLPPQSDEALMNKASAEAAYSFTLQQQDDQNSILQLACSLTLEDSVPSSHPSPRWLKDTLAPKIRHWAEQTALTTAVKSLRLVSLERYNQLYCMLKEKYSADLVKNWTESTDPLKFVYEDIGIAAYLLLIWQDDRKRMGQSKKQSFVDLGCGNGLLVYILTKEGHPGLGIDLRKRNIWETYGTDIKLEERPITPSAENLFPDYDWIIGNHSDELTPWIPVITARSSFTCCYFVLPCCLHDFNCRFNSKMKGESQYRSYLTYVQQVGEACGFQVEEDSLRIPSTKRVCQIGRHRTYSADEELAADKERQEFIDKRCANRHAQESAIITQQSTDSSQALAVKSNCSSSPSLNQETTKRPSSESSETQAEGRNWTDNFQARSSTERVRNCQKVLPQTKERVVQAVFDAVLAADDATIAEGQDGRQWRKGGTIELGKVAAMLDSATRDELKSECGGVQTLLRNHHSIFQVSGGKARLRDFSIEDPWSQHKAAKSRKVDSEALRKTSLCWFNSHHPDGCPRLSANCSFAHGEAELRPRPVTNRKH